MQLTIVKVCAVPLTPMWYLSPCLISTPFLIHWAPLTFSWVSSRPKTASCVWTTFKFFKVFLTFTAAEETFKFCPGLQLSWPTLTLSRSGSKSLPSVQFETNVFKCNGSVCLDRMDTSVQTQTRFLIQGLSIHASVPVEAYLRL